MDLQRFSESSPGNLVPIDSGDLAFVPHALPANFEFDPKLWPLLLEAKSRVSLLEGIGRSLPNASLLLRPLAEREALQSSRLEGTYITAKEFLLFDPEEEASSVSLYDDWQEVNNYRRAMAHAEKTELPISLRLVLQLHEVLTTGIRRSDITPGRFRTHQVAIGADKRFIPPPPQYVQECMHQLERYIHQETIPDPLIHCFLCHYQLETIHPFHDGNGRIGRLLLALMLRHQCGLTKPWLYLSDVLERRREEYCYAMFEVSASSNWSRWIEFCLIVTRDQANETIQRCERLQNLRGDYGQRVSSCGGNARLHAILDELFATPFARVTKIRDTHGVSYPTAKADCQRLVDIGILEQLPNMPLTTYFSRDIFRVAYDGIGEDDL